MSVWCHLSHYITSVFIYSSFLLLCRNFQEREEEKYLPLLYSSLKYCHNYFWVNDDFIGRMPLGLRFVRRKATFISTNLTTRLCMFASKCGRGMLPPVCKAQGLPNATKCMDGVQYTFWRRSGGHDLEQLWKKCKWYKSCWSVTSLKLTGQVSRIRS